MRAGPASECRISSESQRGCRGQCEPICGVCVVARARQPRHGAQATAKRPKAPGDHRIIGRRLASENAIVHTQALIRRIAMQKIPIARPFFCVSFLCFFILFGMGLPLALLSLRSLAALVFGPASLLLPPLSGARAGGDHFSLTDLGWSGVNRVAFLYTAVAASLVCSLARLLLLLLLLRWSLNMGPKNRGAIPRARV